jgi:hypothetical protein
MIMRVQTPQAKLNCFNVNRGLQILQAFAFSPAASKSSDEA